MGKIGTNTWGDWSDIVNVDTGNGCVTLNFHRVKFQEILVRFIYLEEESKWLPDTTGSTENCDFLVEGGRGGEGTGNAASEHFYN